MIWPGGDCPACGETMPRGSVHCRYCQAPLTGGDDSVPTGAGESTPVVTAPVRTKSISAPQRVVSVAAEESPGQSAPGTSPRRSPHPATLLTAGKWLIAALLLAPLCVSAPFGSKPEFSLPIVHSGDEPHYLVIINSVLNDGDFDVSNNYGNVHSGGIDAGRRLAGWTLDHQVNWFAHGHRIHWREVYETDPDRWQRDAGGNPVPTRRQGSYHPVNEREYSQHPPGLAVLLAPVLFPFRGSGLVETMALLCSALATVAGMLAYCRLVAPWARIPKTDPDAASVQSAGAGLTWILLAAAVTYLGSPLWHYGRTLFAEPFLAFLAVAAYAAVLRSQRYLVGGLLLAAGVLIKPPFAVLALPLIAEAALHRRRYDLLCCGLPIVSAAMLLMFWNHGMFGGWLRFPQPWEWGQPVEGLLGLTFSVRHGLLLFAPALLLSLAAIPEWFRRHRRDATLIMTGAGLYLAVMASWWAWWGGWCYSARLILPIVPLLFAPLVVFFNSRLWRSDWRLRWGAAALIAVSILFGAVAAFACENVWERHPLELLWSR